MPSKKKKYNARFPPARIKKIMQTDEEVGKVAAAVPVIISRALELFIESLILKSSETTHARNARTLSTAHIKHIIQSEKKFDFLRDLVANIPDIQQNDDDAPDLRPASEPPAEGGAAAAAGAPDSAPVHVPRPRARTSSAPPTDHAPPDGQPVKRPRGRPRKVRPEPAPEEKLPPKKRGRKKKVPEVVVEEKSDGSETEDANSDNETESADEGSSEDIGAIASPQNNNIIGSDRLVSPHQYAPSTSLSSPPDAPGSSRAQVSDRVHGHAEKSASHSYNENSGSVHSEALTSTASTSSGDGRVHHPPHPHHHSPVQHPGLPYYAPHPPPPHMPHSTDSGHHPHPAAPTMYQHSPGHMSPMSSAYLPHPRAGDPSTLNNAIPPPVPPSFAGQALPYPPPMSFYGSYPQPPPPPASSQQQPSSFESKDHSSS